MYNCNGICTIDFRKVQYYSEVHLIIKEALDFPDYYGENWDAFWDCIVDFAIGNKPVQINILGLDVLERKFGEDTTKMMIELMRDAKYRSDGIYAHLMKIEIVDGDKRVEIQ
ncbi:MAG: barstar family protein [Clostridia bacterium]|nr:barstar family protein [Clostridia bacterium]